MFNSALSTLSVRERVDHALGLARYRCMTRVEGTTYRWHDDDGMRERERESKGVNFPLDFLFFLLSFSCFEMGANEHTSTEMLVEH